MSDSDLLRRYAESGSETAFAEIVERHVHSVYATARRILGDEHLAEDIAQEAFLTLARKASGLPVNTVLSGWLHRTTWHLATRVLRGEWRRRNRERLCLYEPINPSELELLWAQIEPLLDEAIESLNTVERHAVLLRFFEKKPAREMSAALGVSETAARMRVSRAVEKLRVFFLRRGVACASLSLASVLTQHRIESAPTLVIRNIQSAVRGIAGSSLSAPLLLKLFTIMTQIKLKTALITGAALLVALLTGHHLARSLSPNSVYRKISSLESNAPSSSALSQPRTRRDNLFARIARPANPVEAAEAAALEKLRELLYASEPDDSMPPPGVAQAINRCGSQRRAALDLLLVAFKSDDRSAQRRAAASLQFFREAADELMPELLTAFRTSKDPVLIQYSAMPLVVFRGDGELIPTLVQAFQANAAAQDGLQTWLGDYLHRLNNDRRPVIQNLTPLLDSDKAHERWLAATLLSRTDAKNDPRVTAGLLPALDSYRQENVGQAAEALQALKNVGPAARSAAPMVREYGERLPQMQAAALDTLAVIAPDLRSELPSLDAKLMAMDAAAALEDRAKHNQAGVPELVEALGNPEARMRAPDQLAQLGNQAATALPKLRQILSAGDSDPRPDANNFLFSLATAIQRLDPKAPSYYRPEDLVPAFMDATEPLKGEPAKESFKDEIERRMFSPRPFDRDEIAHWVDKLQAADPQARQAFVRRLARGPAFDQLEIRDPELAKALAQGSN